MASEAELLKIASTFLGKNGGYVDKYDPSLLVKIPRSINRELYGIDDLAPGFSGCDVWNCYEVSALTEKGLPVSAVAKILLPSDSRFHVESKSLKLYLNSFNMTKIGENRTDCLQKVRSTVQSDLASLLGHDGIRVSLFTEGDLSACRNSLDAEFEDILSLIPQHELEAMVFEDYRSDPSLLEVGNSSGVIRVKSDLLRSNCRVTHQPDWGTVYIYMKGTELPSMESLLRYIISHRSVFHFHEEICEMIYKHLSDRFLPSELMVACNYTRRGGIDINPVRASQADLIPQEYTDMGIRLEKTLRQ